MPLRGFCQHGKVWTTCAQCGKEVIATYAGKRGGSGDDFEEVRVKKKAVKRPPDEPAEGAGAEEEGGED